MKKVVVKKEALLFLDELVAILIENEYFGFVESSLEYVNRIYDFIHNDLPHITHYETPEMLKHYGKYYVKLKSNKRTMWYVFFDKYESRYIVEFITNNHTSHSAYLNTL